MRPLPLLGLALAVGLPLAACGDGSRDRAPGTGSATNNNPGNNNPGGNNNSNNNNPGGTITPDHPTLCNTACSAPSEGPCATANVATCTDQCAALTNGFPSNCAACLLSESGFTGRACTCYGEGCNLCGFGPDDSPCAGGSDSTCSAAEEVCDGFETADVLGGPCEAACLGTEPPPDLTATLRDRCVQRCADRPNACGSLSAADCLTTCLTAADGVSGACGLCRIESSGWAGRGCNCYGEGCSLCGFGPGDDAPCSGGSDSTCSAEEETCRGFEVGPPTGDCADYCL